MVYKMTSPSPARPSVVPHVVSHDKTYCNTFYEPTETMSSMITTLQWYNSCCLCARSRNGYTTTAIYRWFPCMPLSNDVSILPYYRSDIYQFRNPSITLCSLLLYYVGQHAMWEHALSSLMRRTQFTYNNYVACVYSCNTGLSGHV